MDHNLASAIQMAITNIKKDGWIREKLKTKEGRCILGGFVMPYIEVDKDWLVWRGAVNNSVVLIHLILGITMGTLPLWNDDRTRTKEEVLDALYTAKRLAEWKCD